jgi:hypothetical protein
MTVHCFTFIINYIPKARILANTLKKHNPEWVLHVVLSEPLVEDFHFLEESFDNIILLKELGIPSVDSWLFQHKVTEICTAVKGQTAAFLFENKDAEKVVYLDPDIAVFNSLQPVVNLLDQHPIILTPHQNRPDIKVNDIINNEIGSLRWGVFNLGFFAVSRRIKNFYQLVKLINRRDDIPLVFTDQHYSI